MNSTTMRKASVRRKAASHRGRVVRVCLWRRLLFLPSVVLPPAGKSTFFITTESFATSKIEDVFHLNVESTTVKSKISYQVSVKTTPISTLDLMLSVSRSFSLFLAVGELAIALSCTFSEFPRNWEKVRRTFSHHRHNLRDVCMPIMYVCMFGLTIIMSHFLWDRGFAECPGETRKLKF